MNICVIPARGGSKRIPKKNIKKFNGKPIIAYSIDAAFKSKCFEEIIVSTDDDEVASISLKYGAKVPFKRPKNLSDDYTPTIPVIKHAINWFEKNNNMISNICCLYATAPFVKPEFIKESYEQFVLSNSKYCFSATSYAFPIQRAIKILKNKKVSMFFPENFNLRSQDLIKSYHDAGQFYWGKVQAYKDEISMFSNEAEAYILPRYLVQDIDDNEDWIRAEMMYKLLKYNLKI